MKKNQMLYLLIPTLVVTITVLQSCSSSTFASDKELNINLRGETTVTDHEENMYMIFNEFLKTRVFNFNKNQFSFKLRINRAVL